MADEAPTRVLCADNYIFHMEEARRYVEISMPKEATNSSSFLSPSLDDGEGLPEEVPETVLQYERQMRKVNAAKKASQILTREDHLSTIYKDDYLVVANKPSGILSVPGINNNPSLLTLIYDEYVAKNENPNKIKRDTMICHRLDMDTSGLLVFGLTKDVTTGLHKCFREGLAGKQYQALVCGHVWADCGLIDLPLQRDHQHPPFMRISTPSTEQEAAQVVKDLQHRGWKKLVCKKPKQSRTEFTVLERTYLETTQLPVTRLSLTPITGRTHQLRVHCAAMGHPIVGDPAYGIYGEASANGGFSESVMNEMAPPNRALLQLQKSINDAYNRQMCLHAKTLSLPHPVTHDLMNWEAPVPF